MKLPPEPDWTDKAARWLADHPHYQIRTNDFEERLAARLRRQWVSAMARKALALGELKRAPCEECSGEPAEMHHEDYDKPLEVQWLCRPCHRARHRALGWGFPWHPSPT